MTPRIKKNLIVACVAFLMCLVSVYFGMSIYNASHYGPIQHLNEADKIFYYDEKFVPALTIRAAIVTSPFILTIIILSTIIVFQSNRRQVKNLAKGSLAAALIISVFDILTIANPIAYDFSKWGFAWIMLGMIIIWANLLAVFIKEN